MKHRRFRFTSIIALAVLLVTVSACVATAAEFGWPVPGHTTITTRYKYSSGSYHSCRYWYNGNPAGVDIAVSLGTEVFAPAAGTVQSLADLGSSSFGRYFEIKHDDGTITLYGHLSEFKVSNGQRVNKGDLIALSGSTGNSTGPHLHFEMTNRDVLQYYQDNGFPDPRYDNPIPSNTTLSPGLTNLTSSRYAKVFTLENKKYYDVYSNANLTTRISSTAWTGESDEIWIVGVGVNSNNRAYAKIKYPVGSSRQDAYTSLSNLIAGSETSSARTAQHKFYGLARRRGESRVGVYGIDVGDSVYLLAKVSSWCQVLYPVGSYWRIAWMTESEYNSMFDSLELTKVPYESAVAGVSYRFQCEANGSTSSWSLSNGVAPSNAVTPNATTPPPGLSINSSGVISGTIGHTSTGKKSRSPMRYYFKVRAADSEKQASITVYEPPEITTASSLKDGRLNQSYSQEITADGTERTMRWKLRGSLPPGLKLTANASSRTAKIEGTPTKAGYYTFELECYNLVGNPETTTTRTFNIKVGTDPWVDPNLKTIYSYYDGKVGKYYSDYVKVPNSNFDGVTLSGNYPPDSELKLVLSSSRRYIYFEGTPSQAKTYNFTITPYRNDGGYYNNTNHSITIKPSIPPIPFPDPSMYAYFSFYNGTLGKSYSDWVLVTGGSTPITPSRVSGTLPTGLTLRQSGRYTYLSGVPKRTGTFTFKLRFLGAHNGYVEKQFTITIADNPSYRAGAPTGSTTSKPKFSSKTLPDASVGTEYEATLEAYGTTPMKFLAAEALPDGFHLDEDTGVLSGIPTKPGKLLFKITIENEIGSVTKTLKLKVVPQAPKILTTSLPDGYVKVPYEFMLDISGSDLKLKKIGSLPSGLKFDKKTGIISGTPKKAGTYKFSIQAKNKTDTDVVEFELTIKNDDSDSDTKQTQSSSALSLSAASPEPVNNNGHAPAVTELYLLSGDEKLTGAIAIDSNLPATFGIAQWVDAFGRNVEVSDVEILLNDEALDEIEISEENTFTLSQDMLQDEFTLQATANSGEDSLKTSELLVTANAQIQNQKQSQAHDSGNSSGGCNSGYAGMITLALCAYFALKKN